MEVLKLAATAHGGLVLDLGGLVFKGPLTGPPPHVLAISRASTVIRNGVLELPNAARLLIEAPDCRMESVVIKGPGIASLLGMSAAVIGLGVRVIVYPE